MANNEEPKEIAKREESTAIAIPQEDFFASLNHKDVVKHLANRVEGAWIYEFSIGGKQVVNLGCDGAIETGIALAQLSQGRFVIETIGMKSVTDYGDCIDAEVEVGLFTKGMQNGSEVSIAISKVIGYASQPKILKKRDGSRIAVNHPRTQAVHKAQRNAMNKLIPEKLRQSIINIALKQGKVETEDEEAEGTKTDSKSPKKKGEATDKQLDLIGKLLNSEFISDDTRDKCDKKIAKGISIIEASNMIGMLKGEIENTKAEQMGQGELV